MSESTTDGRPVQSGPADGRWCAACDAAIEGEGEVHDEELVCPACGLARRAEEAREALADARLEEAAARLERDDRLEQYDDDLAELERDRDADLADLEVQLADCERVRREAESRLAALSALAEGGRLPIDPPPPPISGGAPYEPTDEDWADYRAHFDAAEPRYGYE